MKIGAMDAISLSISGMSLSDIKELSNIDSDVPVKDIVELSKGGTSIDDIKELLSFGVSGNAGGQEDHENHPDDNHDNSNGNTGNNDDSDIDYKKLFEESQAKLKEAQQKNVNQNMGNQEKPKDIADILAECF